MRKAFQFAALGLAVVSVPGCFGGVDFDEDSGPQVKKELKLEGFDKVSANGSMEVTIVVGEKESINLQGDQERIDNLKATVTDGELVLDEDSGLFGSHGKLHVTITVPSLAAFQLNGSGEAHVSGVDSESFELSVNGSGDLEVSGKADQCTISVNGSGEVDAKDLDAKTSKVAIAGSGDVRTTASDALDVTIAGSGDVTYFGKAKVNSNVTGSGDVTKG